MQIEEIQRKVLPILKKRAVRRAGVFGSTARGEVSPRDVDMLVEMPRPYGLFAFMALKHELEDELGVAVDLVDYKNIKPALRKNVLGDEVQIL